MVCVLEESNYICAFWNESEADQYNDDLNKE